MATQVVRRFTGVATNIPSANPSFTTLLIASNLWIPSSFGSGSPPQKASVTVSCLTYWLEEVLVSGVDARRFAWSYEEYDTLARFSVASGPGGASHLFDCMGYDTIIVRAMQGPPFDTSLGVSFPVTGAQAWLDVYYDVSGG